LTVLTAAILSNAVRLALHESNCQTMPGNGPTPEPGKPKTNAALNEKVTCLLRLKLGTE